MLFRKEAGCIRIIGTLRLPTPQKWFYFGYPTGAIDSNVLTTRQWGGKIAQDLGAGIYLSLSTPMEAMDWAILIIIPDHRYSKEFIVGAIFHVFVEEHFYEVQPKFELPTETFGLNKNHSERLQEVA